MQPTNPSVSRAEDVTEASLDGFARPSDPERLAARDTLEVLLTRFAEECRQGTPSAIEAYAQRYPEYAQEIRDLFPLILPLENWRAYKELESLPEEWPDQLRGHRLGEYGLVREIGRGGCGVVFEAKHTETGHRVAIKVLPLGYLSMAPQRREQLRREAAVLAQLRHPQIVPVYTFGEEQRYCYYVMQYVEGRNLSWLIDRLRQQDRVRYSEIVSAEQSGKRTPTGELLLHRQSWIGFARLGKLVAGAIQHAHERGILHNDLKPANLLLTATGNIVVTDFGVGWQADAWRSQTAPAFVGTLRYMAPERFSARGDARSDVYSLGVTLYELVSQHPLFPASDRGQLLYQVLNHTPRPLTELVPAIPQRLADIIHQALNRHPQERYPSMQAFKTELSRFIDGHVHRGD